MNIKSELDDLLSQDDTTWGLFENTDVGSNYLEPICWNAGDVQNQLSAVKEIITFLKKSKQPNSNILKFLSFMGSGKSAISIHVCREMGKGIIVVPEKNLQKQWVNDYDGKKLGSKFVLKSGNGEEQEPVDIKFILGRNNFNCKYKNDGTKCDNRKLPCTVPLKGKKRYEICNCKYWIPPPIRITDDDDILRYKDNIPFGEYTDIVTYKAQTGTFGIFVRGKYDFEGNKLPEVCEYYKQFYHYEKNDILVMNSEKHYIETLMGRKPLVDVEIIDEADDWLDRLSQKSVITRISRNTLEEIIIRDNKFKEKILKTFDIYFRKLRKEDFRENREYKNLFSDIKSFLKEYLVGEGDNDDIEDNYIEKMVQNIDNILTSIEDVVIDYDRDKFNQDKKKIFLITYPYPDRILKKLMDKSAKNIILMSGTFHDPSILDELFGLNDNNYNIKNLIGRGRPPVEPIFVIPPPYELPPVYYSRWNNKDRELSKRFRQIYSDVSNNLIDNIKINVDKRVGNKGIGKIMIFPHALSYIEGIKNRDDVAIFTSKDRKRSNNNSSDIVSDILELKSVKEDNSDNSESDDNIEDVDYLDNDDIFKTNKQVIITTLGGRGYDGKDNKCRAIILMKDPFPPPSIYFQGLEKRFGKDIINDIKRDMADRKLIQIICRGLRHQNDWMLFSSPDYNCLKKACHKFGKVFPKTVKRI